MLIWLLHQKGLFDPLYDWWEDRFWADNHSIGGTHRHSIDVYNPHIHFKHHKQEARHYSHDAKSKQRSIHGKHRHKHSSKDSDYYYYYYLHHVNKNKHKHGRRKSLSIMHRVYSDKREDDSIRQCRPRKERDRRPEYYLKMMKNDEEKHDVFDKHQHGQLSDRHFKLHAKHRE